MSDSLRSALFLALRTFENLQIELRINDRPEPPALLVAIREARSALARHLDVAPLSDLQIDELLERERMKWEGRQGPPDYEFAVAFARSIERAHGIEPQGPNSEAPAK